MASPHVGLLAGRRREGGAAGASPLSRAPDRGGAGHDDATLCDCQLGRLEVVARYRTGQDGVFVAATGGATGSDA